jgi:multiple sugar transport system substrate-binding protein
MPASDDDSDGDPGGFMSAFARRAGAGTGASRSRTPRAPKLLVAAGAVLVVTASCSSGGAGPAPGDGSASTTITWYANSIDRTQNDYRQALINEFRNANPSIKVDLVSQPPRIDAREKLMATLRGDGAPDVYLGDVIWPAEFADEGLARPLDGDFDPDFWRRFPKELLSAMEYRGKTYAVPFFADQGMLYYRTDLVPSAPTTWEQLVQESARVLREGHEGVEYGFVWQGDAYEGLTCNWTEILADAGGRTLDAAGTASQVDSPQGLRALRFLRGLLQDGITPREVTGFQETDAGARFTSGRAVFLRGWNSTYTRMNAPSNPQVYGKVGVAPPPTFAGRPGPGYSAVGGWSLYINPRTRKLDAARTFVDWLTDVHAQRILARFSQIPANARVRGDPDARENPAIATGLAARPVDRPSHTPKYPAVSRAIYSTVNDALDGQPSVEDALREMDGKLGDALR